jgi:energy-coupling factor transporter ATP-binding protein EcfA2
MTTIEKNIFDSFKTFNTATIDYLGILFINIFKQFPKSYFLYFNKDNKIAYKICDEKIDLKDDISIRFNSNNILKNALKASKKNDNLMVFSISSNEWIILNNEEDNYFLLTCIISEADNLASYYDYIFTVDIKKTFKIIKNWYEPVNNKEDAEFGITAINVSGGLYTSWFTYPYKDIDINLNYNDNLPYDKICNLIEKEKTSELLLFYGEPGTGKSTLIKHLICKYPEMEFVFMDGTLLAQASQEKLMSYFLENENTVFILEDCEKSLMDRENNYNPVMPILLNITDGIVGDVLGIKIICTFNTALSKIDKALLRKGRLSLKYEFKKLNKDKVKKILNNDNINEDMTLADIYNIEEENDFSKKQTTKIGF